MNEVQQKEAARKFSEYWSGKGYERGQSQSFWLSLLQNVYGVEHPEEFIIFEEQVHIDETSFIDAMIPSTKVMIEQKGLGKDLRKPIRQSDGQMLSPYQQALRYIPKLPRSQHPRWVVTSNFAEFNVYDMEHPGGEPEVILLKDLETEYYRLQFLVDEKSEHLKREMEVSIAAGEIVGLLYDAFAKQYQDPTSDKAMKSLNVLCVRLVFCLYAEDAGIFGKHAMFHDYLAQYEPRQLRRALIDLFKTLDTPISERDPYLKDDAPELAAFPYVNGGLFRDESIEIPPITDEIRDLLLSKASDDFDWSQISPTIFGAVFESTLNPETRRSGGMHYTSIENIHKVIDPLFLDDLKKEFAEISAVPVEKTRNRRLDDFQKKIASLTFLDSSCGSGNFLTETYISLRRLENDVLKARYSNQIMFGSAMGEDMTPIQVSISNFYGIEINDFAVTVAKTALWIAESQMMQETETIIKSNLEFLPLKTNAGIVEGNALTMDWEELVPKDKLNYIMGNPPFVGYSFQSPTQKKEILSIYVDEKGKPYKTAGKIDYVSGWYFKAAKYMKGTAIRTAFVSTNSITQGEQVASVWKPLFDRFNIHIDFAHRTFRWDSESDNKAHVHCVIVGFSCKETGEKRKLFFADQVRLVDNINPYLLAADNVFIQSRSKPVCDVPEMVTGNRPADGGNLIIEAKDYDEFIRKEPSAVPYIKRLIGSEEFINGKKRYCLWLVGVTPDKLCKMPLVMKRIKACREDRLASPDAGRRKLADTPALFRETLNPETYIAVPVVSSENRKYIPMDFLTSKTICTDRLKTIPDATMYHFGILMSNVHMAWMRAVCGRLKSDYNYSKDVVYNNFPWPKPTEQQRRRIEQTAQAILDARALYPDSSLADLYNELTMPPELRAAHQNNDRAVMQAYGFDIRQTTESTCVAELMRMYQKMADSGK